MVDIHLYSTPIHFVVDENLDHLLQPDGRKDVFLVHEDHGGNVVPPLPEDH